MLPFRFIHVADLHLDSLFIGMSGIPHEMRTFLQNSTFAALEHLVNLAVSEAVDFIVISGDVFDASNSSLRAQLRLQEVWEQLGRHQIAVYVIHGNHDPLNSPRVRLPVPPHVHVFGPQIESITARRRLDNQPVAIVSGMSYPQSSVTDNLSLQYYRDLDSPLYHIALLHANVDGQEGHDVYAPCSRKDLINSGYDYWALGHIHKRQIINESPWIVYPGNIQGRSMKESGAKGCYVVNVMESGESSLQFHELDVVRWHDKQLSITGIDGLDAWTERVEQLMEEVRTEEAGRMNIVRITFIDRGPVHRQLESGQETEELVQELRRRELKLLARDGADVMVWPSGFKVASGVDIDRDALLEEDSFIGELLRLGHGAENDDDRLNDLMSRALSSLMDNRPLVRLLKETGPEERLAWLRRAEELAASLLWDNDEKGGDAL